MSSDRQALTRKKIVRVIARLNIGGPAHQTVLLSHALHNDTWETTLAVGALDPSEGDASYLLERTPCRWVRIPELQRSIRPWKDLAAAWKLFRLLRQEKPDILHTHTAKAGTLGRLAGIGYRLTTRRPLKMVHTFHGHVFQGYFGFVPTKFFLAIERWLATHTDRLIAVSNAVKEDLVALKIGRPEKIQVIPLGLNLEQLLGLNGRTTTSDPVKIGIVGRLVPIKNHQLFLQAIEKLKAAPLEAIVVGDGELREPLEKMCRALDISERVRFTGWQQDLPSVYGPLDIVCLSSLNEGTPVSLIEALAAGKAVVSTDVGGVRDLVGPPVEPIDRKPFQLCRHGILVRSGDAEGFAKALQFLIEHPQRREQMGQQGRAFVRERFLFGRLVRDIEQLYRRLACAESS